MDAAEFDYTAFQHGAQDEQDKALLVKFYLRTMPDKKRTAEEGRPIFREREFVDIRAPGSREGAVRPATRADKSRFPRHYEAFKARVEMPVEGTPLGEWPLVARSQVEEMAFFNIKTVEQLASLNDNSSDRFNGGAGLKRKAQEWLARAEKELTAAKLEQELASRDNIIAALQAQMAELMAARPKRKSRAKPKAMPVEGDPMEDTEE